MLNFVSLLCKINICNVTTLKCIIKINDMNYDFFYSISNFQKAWQD